MLELVDARGDPAVVVVNCTGLSASQFCDDKNMYPIRGQTLLVRTEPPLSREILLWDSGNSVTYIVPRPGTDAFILGGTKDDNNGDSLPTPQVSEGIIQRCERLLASKGIWNVKFDILQEQVGFRPGRKGGVRVEAETVQLDQDTTAEVVHNYGHAGAGYQASIGSAEKVLGLVRDILG